MRFIMSQLCNQVNLAKRKMETQWSGKFESFVADTIVNKTFTGLKLAKSAFLIDESKKKLLHVHFKKLNLWSLDYKLGCY